MRGLARSPGFTATAVLSLALGIGANTSIFSFVNVILLTHLPVPEPARLVTFSQISRGEISQTVWRMRTVEEVAKRGPAFEGVAGRFAKQVRFSRGDKAQWLTGELVTGQYFRTMGIGAALGRVLTEDDIREAKARPVCVLSYGFWQSEFAGDPRVLGRNVFQNGHAYQVAG